MTGSNGKPRFLKTFRSLSRRFNLALIILCAAIASVYDTLFAAFAMMFSGALFKSGLKV